MPAMRIPKSHTPVLTEFYLLLFPGLGMIYGYYAASIRTQNTVRGTLPAKERKYTVSMPAVPDQNQQPWPSSLSRSERYYLFQ